MDIILLVVMGIIVWVMGVKAGWDAREKHARKITKEFLDVMQEAEEEEPSFINITIEKHNNIFYVYERDTNEFMAQGSTQKEVEANLRKRYPGKSFGCAESVLSDTGFFS
jgi:hypothetical protein